jgi:hypothetical protein
MTKQPLIEMPAGRGLAKALTKAYYGAISGAIGMIIVFVLVATAVLQTIEIGVYAVTGEPGPFHLRIEDMPPSGETAGLALGLVLLGFVTIPIILYAIGLLVPGRKLLTGSENS